MATGATLTAGTWYHLVALRNGSTISVYVDTVKGSDGTLIFPPALSDQNVYIGESTGWSGREFNGTIDEVRVYNRNLSEDEISTFYHNYMEKMGSYYNVRQYASPEPTSAVGDEIAGDYALPVTLSSFTASVSNGTVTLYWRTESEVENMGFNVYRSESEDGIFARINDFMIPGAGSSPISHEYVFTDSDVEMGYRYYYYLESVDFAGGTDKSQTIGVFVSGKILGDFSLMQNYPNPFNPITTISFTLPEAQRMNLSVYDISGRLVATVADGWREAGSHEVTFDGSSLASGVYLYTLEAGQYHTTGKMVLMK